MNDRPTYLFWGLLPGPLRRFLGFTKNDFLHFPLESITQLSTLTKSHVLHFMIFRIRITWNTPFFNLRYICCLWGRKNCKRRFGETLPKSRKRCQFLAPQIRARWCGQNWRLGTHQTQTSSQIGRMWKYCGQSQYKIGQLGKEQSKTSNGNRR